MLKSENGFIGFDGNKKMLQRMQSCDVSKCSVIVYSCVQEKLRNNYGW